MFFILCANIPSCEVTNTNIPNCIDVNKPNCIDVNIHNCIDVNINKNNEITEDEYFTAFKSHFIDMSTNIKNILLHKFSRCFYSNVNSKFKKQKVCKIFSNENNTRINGENFSNGVRLIFYAFYHKMKNLIKFTNNSIIQENNLKNIKTDIFFRF